MKKSKVMALLGALSLIFILMMGQACALNAEQVYAKVKDSIYTLYGVDFRTKKAVARGSAVAVAKGILATNCHVALMGNFLVVKVDNTNRVGQVLYKDEKQDLCLVDVPGVTFQPVKIRDSSQVKIGEVVFAVGNPEGTEKTLSQGIISNRHNVDGGIWLQTDATIYFGSSGGGLFDDNGELIGITSKMGGNFGFATPTEWILNVLNPAKGQTMASEEPSQAPLSPPQLPATAQLQLIANYGNAGLGLYRNNQECFIAVLGKNGAGKQQGLAIWNPHFATRMVIFSSAHSVAEALELLLRSVEEGKTAKNSDYVSSNKLYIGNKSYVLQGTSSSRERYAYFVVRFTESPLSDMQQARKISVTFDDPDPKISQANVTYDLNGLSDALAAYETQCH